MSRASSLSGSPDGGTPIPDNPAASPRATPAEELQRLRELLLAPDRARLEKLERKERALTPDDVGRVLPEAVHLRARSDPSLSNALSPVVEGALRESIRRDPQSLVDAIFPIMGPAIRRSIQSTLRGFVDNLNRTAEQSLSLKGLGWRLEAWRTRRSFAEVALRHNLIFRVEQVFLIHRDSGVLLDDATSPSVAARDPELVSSMLSALQSFVSDSFEGEGLDRLDFGDQVLLISQGPQAVLAAVAQGTAPSDFATRMAETLEAYHAQLGDSLRDFSGDTTSFELHQHRLQALLVEKTRQSASRSRARIVLPILAGLVGIALLAWIFTGIRRGHDFEAAVASLVREPGIQVTHAERDGAQIELRGLRDPDANDPTDVVAAAGIAPERLLSTWEPFVSQAPSVVLRRARRLFDPPEHVQLDFTDGVLTARGTAPHGWIRRTRLRAPLLAGVTRFDDSALADPELAQLEGAVDALRAYQLEFLPGQSVAAVASERDGLAQRMQAAERTAQALDARLYVTVRGQAALEEDAGPELALTRAQYVAQILGEATRGEVTELSLATAPPASAGELAVVALRVRWQFADPPFGAR